MKQMGFLVYLINLIHLWEGLNSSLPDFIRIPEAVDLRINKSEPKTFANYAVAGDPMWPHLWYLNRHMDNSNLTDMNITSAWMQGFTGKGITVAFLDDGLEWVSQ